MSELQPTTREVYLQAVRDEVIAPAVERDTHDSATFVEPAPAVEDCDFRMLQPRERLRAQRFHDAYVVHGNLAQWLGERITVALDQTTGGS